MDNQKYRKHSFEENLGLLSQKTNIEVGGIGNSVKRNFMFLLDKTLQSNIN